MIGSLVTKRGKELLAQAVAVGKELKLSEVRFSDYAGDINENMDILVGVKHTQPLTSKIIDPLNQDTIILETLLPTNVGGFYIETLGVYTETNELFALVRIKQTYKSHIVEAIPTDIQVKIHIQVSNASNITLAIDESVVLASREYVNATMLEIKNKFERQDLFIKSLEDNKANKDEVYTKLESDKLLSDKVDKTKLLNYTKNIDFISSQAAQDRQINEILNNMGKVELKSVRSSEGDWTITNIIPNKMLIITISSISAGCAVRFSIVAGSADGNINATGTFVTQLGTYSSDASASSVILVPTQNYITLRTNYSVGNWQLRAYQ